MTYLPLLAAWAIAVISPGPDFVAVLRTAAARGRRHGVVVGIGVVCSIACWATLALTGLSLLLSRYAHLYLVLRGVGAIFLLGYGLHILWSTWRSRSQDGEQTPDRPAEVVTRSTPVSLWRSWRLGLATNLANPKAVIFFGALFATVLPPHLGVPGKAGVVAVMLGMGLAWFSLVAAVAGSAPIRRGYERAERKVDAVAGGLFAAVGVALLPH